MQLLYRMCPADARIMRVLAPSFALALAALSPAFVDQKGMAVRRMACVRLV